MNQKNHGLIFSAGSRHDGEHLFAFLKREAKASKPVIQYWVANEKIKVNHKKRHSVMTVPFFYFLFSSARLISMSVMISTCLLTEIGSYG